MVTRYAPYKFNIGEEITSYGRNLKIIDREYRSKIIYPKNESSYVGNFKYYKYKCLKCGNEDWLIEYVLGERQHCGCNACGCQPKKLVKGVNDITTTAPWMIKYFPGGYEQASQYFKFSKDRIDFICPDCGRVHNQPIGNIMTNKGLSCVCKDGVSYPNKVIYSILEQLGLSFKTEQHFSWSEKRIYDFYIKYNGKEIIIEAHGNQHYKRAISKNGRTIDEEQANDRLKEMLAMQNGIDKYFVIDCRLSDIDYIKGSLINSKFFEYLGINCSNIDWDECDKFAISNFAKTICEYKDKNKNVRLSEIADIFNINYISVLKYIKLGNKYGWCNYELDSDRRIVGKIEHGQKPIYCVTNGVYYRDSNTVSKLLSNEKEVFYPRQIRQSISRNNNYKNHKFIYVSREEFNNAKLQSPDKVVGGFFK